MIAINPTTSAQVCGCSDDALQSVPESDEAVGTSDRASHGQYTRPARFGFASQAPQHSLIHVEYLLTFSGGEESSSKMDLRKETKGSDQFSARIMTSYLLMWGLRYFYLIYRETEVISINSIACVDFSPHDMCQNFSSSRRSQPRRPA